LPRLDGSGPQGFGPMSGGGFGYCVPRGRGRGYRYGYGFGPGVSYGIGRGVWGRDLSRTERELLAEERDRLEARLKAIDAELDEE